MSAGVTAYAIKISDIKDKLFGSNNRQYKKFIKCFPNPKFSEIKNIFRRSGSINPDKAFDEILAGVLTRTDGKSGAVYRYVLEVLCWMEVFKTAKEQKEIWHLAQEERKNTGIDFDTNVLSKKYKIPSLSRRLPNDTFYPIGLDEVMGLFKYPDIPLPFPRTEDYPMTAVIPYDEIVRLSSDFSELQLLESCHQQFKWWIDYCIKHNMDLMLYYY